MRSSLVKPKTDKQINEEVDEKKRAFYEAIEGDENLKRYKN